MKPCLNPFLRRAAFATIGLALSQMSARAATYWWDTTTTNTWGAPFWSDNFYTGGTTSSGPTSTDIGIFNQAGLTAASTTANLATDASAAGLVFNNTSTATILQSPTSHNNLTIGSSGILINTGAATVSLGDSVFANFLGAAQLNADQSWVNNATTTFTLNSNVKALTSSRALTIGGTGATTFLIGLQDNGAALTSLVKSGSGLLTFTDATAGTGAKFTFTGGITANAGRILLNSTLSSTSGFANIVASQALAMGGGALVATWANTVSSLSNQQTFTGATLNAGASTIGANNSQATASTTKNAVINLGAITRNAGSTVNLSATGNATAADRIRIGSSSFGASQIILANGVAYATGVTSTASNLSPSSSADNWAFTDSSSLFDRFNFAPSYTTVAAAGTLASSTIADVTGSPTTMAGPISLTALRISGVGGATINTGGNTLTTGGILVASTAAGTLSITGGTLKSAATVANKDLVIIQNSANSSLDLTGTVIAAATVGATGLTKSGVGGLNLGANNTYTGPTYINGGWIFITSDGTNSTTNSLGAYPGSPSANNITLNGGGLNTGANVTLAANRGVTLGGNGGTFFVATATTLDVNGIITSATGVSTANSYGALQINNSFNLGTVTLGGNNPFIGGVQINNGELKLTNAGALNSTLGSENTVIMNQASTVAASGLASAGSVLTLNGNSVTLGDLKSTGTAGAFPGVVQNANALAATLTVGNSQNLQSGAAFNGLMQDGGSGSLSLVKTGGGTLSLAPSIVRAGASWGAGASGVTVTVTGVDTTFLQVGTAFTGITGGVTIASILSGTSFTFTSSAAVTAGSGSLTFSQKLDTYTGGTFIKNGTLGVGSQALPFKATTGTTYPVTLGDAVTNTSGVLLGQGSNTVSSIATAGTGGLNNLITVNSGIGFTVNGSGAQTFDGTIGGAGSFTYSGSGSLNLTGKVTSGGTVTASGTGTLILSTANTYTGATNVSNGVGGNLTVTDPKAFGTTSGIIFASGGNAKLVINTASTLVEPAGTLFSRPITGAISTGGLYTINVD